MIFDSVIICECNIGCFFVWVVIIVFVFSKSVVKGFNRYFMSLFIYWFSECLMWLSIFD